MSAVKFAKYVAMNFGAVGEDFSPNGVSMVGDDGVRVFGQVLYSIFGYFFIGYVTEVVRQQHVRWMKTFAHIFVHASQTWLK